MIYKKTNNYTIHNASCLDVMDEMEANSIDAIITDPPYEIGFMGKKWDSTGIAFNIKTWKKALRVLKPGGYLLAFNHSRTFHRMMIAVEDAGFELRDTIMWLYGSGFPKSHNVGLSIDKKLGHPDRGHRIATASRNHPDGTFEPNGEKLEKYVAKSSEAKKWDGYGTALKPAFEPIVMARKPFKSTVAENVLKYGVGGINIDECRIGNEERTQFSGKGSNGKVYHNYNQENAHWETVVGRFPANIIHDGSEEACSGFPETLGAGNKIGSPKKAGSFFGTEEIQFNMKYDNGGSASRYFYTAKASVKDRDEGLDEFEYGIITDGREKPIDNAYNRGESVRKNIHPTVKPTDLMQYLIRLVAPKGSIILDPFMGSGSTGKACMIENTERNANYHFIGIDLEKEYCDIAKARIEWGINFRQLEDTHILYDDKGNASKVIQNKFDLFGGN